MTASKARPALDLGGHETVPDRVGTRLVPRTATEDLDGIRHELGDQGSVGTGGHAECRRGQRPEDRTDRVDDRLQEQRSLGVVAACGQRGATGRPGDPYELVGQSGLADPGLTGDQQQRRPARGGAVPLGAEQTQLPMAPDQIEGLLEVGTRRAGSDRGVRGVAPVWRRRGPPGRPRCAPGPAPRHRRELGRRPFAEDLQVQGPGLFGRVRAQLAREELPEVGVRRQRPRRFAGDLPGLHQEPARSLVEGVGRHGCGRGHGGRGRVPDGERRLGRQQPGDGEQGHHLGPGGFGPLGVGLVVEGGATADQLQSASRGHRRQAWFAGRQPRPPLLVPAVGDVEVHLHRGPEAVARRPTLDDSPAELVPQSTDQRRDTRRRAPRGRIAPEQVDQRPHRHQTRPLYGEVGDQPAALAAAERGTGHRDAVPANAEHAGELHADLGGDILGRAGHGTSAADDGVGEVWPVLSPAPLPATRSTGPGSASNLCGTCPFPGWPGGAGITPRRVGIVDHLRGDQDTAPSVPVAVPMPARRRSLGELRGLAAEGARDLADAPAAEVIAWAAATFGSRLCVLSSMTDAVLAHLVSRSLPGVPVLFGDTGYHFAETIGMRDAVAATMAVSVVDVRPDQSVAEQAAEYGPDLFATNPDLCCRIRKTEPLRRALSGFDAWCSGIRRGETAARAGAQAVEWDRRRDKVKINPIVAWSDDDVRDYVDAHHLLTNPLLMLGFTSVGCAPCTRAPVAGEDERAGRWAGNAKTECGLHL